MNSTTQSWILDKGMSADRMFADVSHAERIAVFRRSATLCRPLVYVDVLCLITGVTKIAKKEIGFESHVPRISCNGGESP